MLLNKREIEILNKKYPLVNFKTALLLIPAILALIVTPLIALYGGIDVMEGGAKDSDIIIYIVSMGVCGVLFSVNSVYFITAVAKRNRIRKGCIAASKELFVRAKSEQFDRQSYVLLQEFAKDITVYDLIGMVLKALETFADLPKRGEIGVIFVTIRPLGTVYKDDTLGEPAQGTNEFLSGVKKGCWRQVEWRGYRTRERKMILHEIAHAILNLSKVRYDEEKQHRLISASGSEYVLEVVRKNA